MWWTHLVTYYKSITFHHLLPVLFFFSVSQGLSLVIIEDLYIEKTCMVNFNHSEEICSDLFSHKDIQTEVQKHVSVLRGINGPLQALPAMVFAIFAGSWSDVNGRKTIIMLSCFGYVLNNLTFMLNAYFWYDLKAEYLLFECLQDCTGGQRCLILGCYCYLSDISDKKTRTRRFNFLDAVFNIGFMTGLAASPYVKSRLGFLGNFGISMGCTIIAMICTMFLKDSRAMRPSEISRDVTETEDVTVTEDKGCCKVIPSMFDARNIKRAFIVTFKKRAYNTRPFLLILVSNFILYYLIIIGRDSTFYLYTRKEFGWTAKDMSKYNVVFSLLGIFAQCIVVPVLTEKFCIRDSTLGAFAWLTVSASAVITALATEEWLIWVAVAVIFLELIITPSLRSIISKVVGPFEVGAVFSILATFQAAVPFVAGPLFSLTYKATIDSFPGTFLIIVALLCLPGSVLLYLVTWGLGRADQLRRVNENGETEEKALEKKLKNISSGHDT